MILKKIASYITFWKKPDPHAPKSFNLKMMHGINKVSILMFIAAMIMLIFRFIF